MFHHPIGRIAEIAHILVLPVDEGGIGVAAGIEMDALARVAFVTPSHHFPLGMPLSMGRRKALFVWGEVNQS